MKYLFFILIIVVSLVSFNVFENFVECNYDHLILTPSELSTLKELFLEFIRFCKKEKIQYFLIGGSLLGIERHGGLMPFDDNIDVGVCMEDEENIKKYKHPTFYFEEILFGYKFLKKESSMFIDIFIFKNDEGTYRLICDEWPNEYHKKDDLFPLKTINYGDILVNVPNNYMEYLNRSYPDWQNTIKIADSHHNQYEFDKHNLPKEFHKNHDNSKYLCYTNV